jgi:hypothetical protein
MSSDELELARRYLLERAWRQVRQGPPAGRGNDRELSVGLDLIGGNSVQSRSDLVEDEKRNRGGHADVPNETTQRIQKRSRN